MGLTGIEIFLKIVRVCCSVGLKGWDTFSDFGSPFTGFMVFFGVAGFFFSSFICVIFMGGISSFCSGLSQDRNIMPAAKRA
tara:strand:- start:369 stop:611 length:243 start_codon:yes stop_codon:yes gene_type:complete